MEQVKLDNAKSAVKHTAAVNNHNHAVRARASKTAAASFSPSKIAQAYEQAPWRRQMQMIGAFLLVVVAVALVAGIYLNVTARAATIGRQIQDMQVRLGGHQRLDLATPDPAPVQQIAGEEAEAEEIPIEELKIQIADLEGQLARLYAVDVMLKRAEILGFEPIDPERRADYLAYIEVPGYLGRLEANLAPPPEPVVATSAIMPVAYRQSLLDWLKQEAVKTSEILPDQADLRDFLLGGVQR